MKKLIWKFVLPLTIISFCLFTKWWHVGIANRHDDILIGFPFPFFRLAGHTSLALQIFISELCINLLIYFGFWFISVLIVHRFLIQIRLHKAAAIILIFISGILLSGLVLIALNPDNIYTTKRDFDIEIKATGYKLVWEETPGTTYE